MREIAFRVWDIKNKRMNNGGFWVGAGNGLIALVQDVNEDVFSGVLQREKDFILMQFTGLKDKNSKEIYEGDVLQYTWYEDKGQYGVTHDEQMVITFDAGSFSIGRLTDAYQFDPTDWLVVGNIHENPELIDG